MDRLVLVANTHRVAPGLLSWAAWDELRSGPVLTSDAAHPQLPFLEAAGVVVELLGGDDPRERAFAFRERARDGQAVWLTAGGGEPDFVRALGDLISREGGVEMEVVYGSYDLPGARLLDLVSTMDRLRSPGGCPWDAEQTHESLAHYLVEETYEALDAIEQGDLAALRAELGDVLLQVVFHARLAEERTGADRWTIDDVAAGIVEKLVRRHPHVFGDVTVTGAADVVRNWDEIKAAERADAGVDEHPFAHVPLGQPALTLAATLQRKAAKAGLDVPAPDSAEVGARLWALVAEAVAAGADPETELRATARAYRDAHLT